MESSERAERPKFTLAPIPHPMLINTWYVGALLRYHKKKLDNPTTFGYSLPMTNEAQTNQPTLNLPTLVKLPKAYPPTRVMADPDELRMKVVDYFSMLTIDPEDRRHPTPPGLAMALGLRSFDALLHIMQVAEDDPSAYPEASLDVLHVARTHIEDYYINNGLRETIPHAFLKFLLSAYFNRSEKTIQETLNARDNQLNINILGISAPLPLIEATSASPVVDQTTEATDTFTITYDAQTGIIDDLEDL